MKLFVTFVSHPTVVNDVSVRVILFPLSEGGVFVKDTPSVAKSSHIIVKRVKVGNFEWLQPFPEFEYFITLPEFSRLIQQQLIDLLRLASHVLRLQLVGNVFR